MNQYIKKKIRFGTDGWRALIGEDFIFSNIRNIAQAYSEYLKKKNIAKICIGFDNRFLSDRAADIFGKVVASNDIEIMKAESSVPTPALSFAIKHFGAGGGVMITASHNTPEYNGIKFKGVYGGSLLDEDIRTIEKFIPESEPAYNQPFIKKNMKVVKVIPAYTHTIKKIVQINKIKNLRIVIDSMYGSANNILRDILPKRCNITCIHNIHNPAFGGVQPEPIEKNLKELIRIVRKTKSDIGIATDGDGDRIGIISPSGKFIYPPKLMALMIHYLVKDRSRLGAIVRTSSVSDIVANLCHKLNLKLWTVKVGFKHICEVMLKEKVLLGGEESGGIGYGFFIPERDGILSALIMLEIISCRGENLDSLIKALEKDYGKYGYAREDISCDRERVRSVIEQYQKKKIKKIGRYTITRKEMTDGIKFFFHPDGWGLIRVSDTEPLFRVYVESKNDKQAQDILKTIKKEILKR